MITFFKKYFTYSYLRYNLGSTIKTSLQYTGKGGLLPLLCPQRAEPLLRHKTLRILSCRAILNSIMYFLWQVHLLSRFSPTPQCPCTSSIIQNRSCGKNLGCMHDSRGADMPLQDYRHSFRIMQIPTSFHRNKYTFVGVVLVWDRAAAAKNDST